MLMIPSDEIVKVFFEAVRSMRTVQREFRLFPTYENNVLRGAAEKRVDSLSIELDFLISAVPCGGVPVVGSDFDFNSYGRGEDL